MEQRSKLLKHLQEAAEIIRDDEEGFEDSLEELATLAHARGNEADFIAAMLYAASEVIRNR